jgi:hypothetical protein
VRERPPCPLRDNARVPSATSHPRLALAALAATCLAAALPAPAGAALKRPRGTYVAPNGLLELRVAGGFITIAAFDIRCRSTTARTSISQIRIRKARGRYRFSIRTFGLVTYRDDHPDENARIRFSGAFSRNARRVTGTYEVRAPHCGSTRSVMWSARR